MLGRVDLFFNDKTGEGKMRILQINSVCGVGSTGRIATDIYGLVQDQGHDCVIAYGRGKAPETIKTIKIGSRCDKYVHGAITRIFDAHGFGSYMATKRLLEKINAYKPDIIHLHNLHGYYVNIKLLFDYFKEANIPLVWTLHDCWAFTGHCSHFDHAGCTKWITGCFSCPLKRDYPAGLCFDNSKWNYEQKKKLFTQVRQMTLVAPSKWLATMVKQSFLRNYNVRVINNGIDLSIFKPATSKFRQQYGINGKFLILGVANAWGTKKGYTYFIELAQQLEKDEAIAMVGLSENQKRTLPANIIGIKRTNNATELAEIYTAADVFLNPTLDETFGLVNIEALACGTPVITFNTGGSPETIDESCGFITAEKSITEIRASINKLKSNKIDSASCTARAAFFDKRVCFEGYLELYKDLHMDR